MSALLWEGRGLDGRAVRAQAALVWMEGWKWCPPPSEFCFLDVQHGNREFGCEWRRAALLRMTKDTGEEGRACPSLRLVPTVASVLWEERQLAVWHQATQIQKFKGCVLGSWKGCTHRIAQPQQ